MQRTSTDSSRKIHKEKKCQISEQEFWGSQRWQQLSSGPRMARRWSAQTVFSTPTTRCVAAPGGATAATGQFGAPDESQTDQLSLLQFACTGTSATSIPTTVTLTFYTNLPITSKSLCGSAAQLQQRGDADCRRHCYSRWHRLRGYCDSGLCEWTLYFFLQRYFNAGVTIPTSPAGTTTYFQLANLRVNASSATTVPFQSTESGLIAYTTSTTSGTTTAFVNLPATGSSGLVVPSLNPPTITGTVAPYTVCTGNGTGTSFTLNINRRSQWRLPAGGNRPRSRPASSW